MSKLTLFDNRIFKDTLPGSKLIFAVFFTISAFLILSFIFLLLAIPLFHLSFEELNVLLKDKMQEADIAILKYFQVTQSLSLFVVPSIGLNFLIFSEKNDFIRESKIPPLNLIVFIFLLMLCSLPLIDQLSHWNSLMRFPDKIEGKFIQLETQANDISNKLLAGNSVKDFIFNVFIIAMVPAIGEEFLFRGILQQIFSDLSRNVHIAIIISAILFSAIHLQFFGFFPRLMLGILFGYLFFWSRNIWIAVLAHFINNLIAVTLYFLNNNRIISHQVSKYQININYITILLSLIITIILIFLIKKRSEKITIKQFP